MRWMLPIVFGAGALAGLALAAPQVVPWPLSERPVAAADIRPVWHEAKWPFPVDPWGTGRAYKCRAADCGAEVTLLLRAKIGFCNCATGVADDAELERVSDLELVGRKFHALSEGRAVTAGPLKGRSRLYAVEEPQRPRASAIAVAVNDRCDVVVATLYIPSRKPDAWEPSLIAWLNAAPVQRWAERTLGL